MFDMLENVESYHKSAHSRVDLFGISIDALSLEGAVRQILSWVDERSQSCRYVVTPNIDHVVMLQGQKLFSSAYQSADLVLADGFPIVWVSKIFGKSLPERVAGSDLVPALFANIEHQNVLKVFLLGAAPGVADRAAARIEELWPNVSVVGTYSPPIGFERDKGEQDFICLTINSVSPDLLILGLGAPKQEIWIYNNANKIKSVVAICAGATIDFLAGEKTRAPKWIQRIHLEWFFRFLCEPRRLFFRYSRDALKFPQIVLREIIIGRQKCKMEDCSRP